MLKYQVRVPSTYSSSPSSSSSSSSSSSPSSSASLAVGDTTLTSRCNSLLSLASFDSTNSNVSSDDTGTLKVYTSNVKTFSDYKTLRLCSSTTTQEVIEVVVNKFKLSCKDSNLFDLWMEVITRTNGKAVSTILQLDRHSRPLELQRCHPPNMSKFILHMHSTGTLVKIYDHNISPQSNYKSLVLATETSCSKAIQLIFLLNRIDKESDENFALFLTGPDGEAQIPNQLALVPIALRCLPQHKLVIRQVQSL